MSRKYQYKTAEERAEIIALETVPFFKEENITEGNFLYFGEPEVVPPSNSDILAGEIVKMKFDNMQKDALINTLGEELTKIKLEIMTLKGGA